MLSWVSIKLKSRHILNSCPRGFLFQNFLEGGVIFLIMFIWGKHIMYPCHFCVGNMMYLILYFWCSQLNLIIHIYLQHVIEWFVRSIFFWQFCKLWIYIRQIHKLMLCQWSHWGLDVFFWHISSRVQHYKKIIRGLNPPHLKQCWNHQLYWHAWLLWQDIT